MKKAWPQSEVERLNELLAPSRTNRWARRPFPVSPRGITTDGLQDFRGFPLELLASFDIANVDFTGARAPRSIHGVETTIQIESCRCRNVRFDRVGNMHRLGGIFEACSFQQASASRGGLTGIFRDCTFLRSNLSKAHLIGEFYDCEFVGANLKVASWGGSFSNCVFRECRVESMFAEIERVIHGQSSVTFSVLTSGKPRIGEAVKRSPYNNLESLPWVGAEP